MSAIRINTEKCISDYIPFSLKGKFIKDIKSVLRKGATFSQTKNNGRSFLQNMLFY